MADKSIIPAQPNSTTLWQPQRLVPVVAGIASAIWIGQQVGKLAHRRLTRPKVSDPIVKSATQFRYISVTIRIQEHD